MASRLNSVTVGEGRDYTDDSELGVFSPKLAAALWRNESLTSSLVDSATRLSRFTPNKEEMKQAALSPFNPHKQMADVMSNKPWLEDNRARVSLSSARTQEEFDYTLARVEQTSVDRETIDRATLPAALIQSLGVLSLGDPAALLSGGLFGLGLQSSKIAIKGAGKAYSDLQKHVTKLQKRTNWTPVKPQAVKKHATQVKNANAALDELAEMSNTLRVNAVTMAASTAVFETTLIEASLVDQPFRTFEEVKLNILGSAAVGGLLARAGTAYDAFVPRVAGRLASVVEKEKARKGIELLTDGSDSVHPDGAIPDNNIYGDAEEFLEGEYGYSVEDMGISDLEEAQGRQILKGDDTLLDGAQVTARVEGVEIPIDELAGVRTIAAAKDTDSAVLHINQEGDPFITDVQGDVYKNADGVDVIRADIQYHLGAESHPNTRRGDFSQAKLAEFNGFDLEARLAEAVSDRGPMFDASTQALIPADVDAKLQEDFGLNSEGASEIDFAGYVAERGRVAKEWTGTAAMGALKLMAKLHPNMRLKTSELSSARFIGNHLSEDDFVEAGAYRDGRVRLVEVVDTMIKIDENKALGDVSDILVKGMLKINEIAAKPGSSYNNPSYWRNLAEIGRLKLTGRNVHTKEMEAEVTRYIHDKDGYVPSKPYEDPEMQAAIKDIAGEVYSKVVRPWEVRQLEAGMLDLAKVPDGGAFYMQRVWDMDEVNANADELRDILQRQFMLDRQQARATSDEANANLQAADRVSAGQDADAFITSLRNNKLHIEEGEISGNLASLKKRAPIKSALVMKFLDKNLGRNLGAWVKNISPEYRLQQSLGGKDYMENMNAAMAKEVSERTDALTRLRNATEDPKQIKALEKEMASIRKASKDAKRDIEGIVQIMKNKYGIPDDPDSKLNSAGKLLRAWNFMTKLGGMTVSSFVDPAYLIAKAGFMPAMKALFKAGSPFKGMRKLESEYLSLGTDEALAFRNDAHLLHVVSELQNHSRVESNLQMQDANDFGNKVDSSINVMTTTFAKATFMSQWNDFMKSVSHMAYSLKIKDAIDNPTLKSNRDFLVDMGIDERMAGIIRDQWKAKGTKQVGDLDGKAVDFDAPNMRDWHQTDGVEDPLGREAQTLLTAALVRKVDSTIVTPGAGDLPLGMRSPLGKIIFQFQAFPITVLSRVVIPAVQKAVAKGEMGNVGEFARLTNAVLFGMAVYQLKQLARGDDISDDWRILLKEGIERSGVFGIYFNGFSLGDELTDFAVTEALLGEDYEGQYRSQNPIMNALSASTGTLTDMGTAFGAVYDGVVRGEDMTWSQGSAIRRLTIFNNVTQFKILGRMLQDYAMDAEDPNK